VTTTITAAVVDGKAERVESILKRSVCLVLHCYGLGNHRRVELAGMEMERSGMKLAAATIDQIGASKQLFDLKDLAPCNHIIASVKHKLRAMSVDGGTRLFGPSTYMLPLLSVKAAEQALTESAAELAKEAAKLADRLPEMIEGRRAKLGPLFHEADYPTADEMRAAYRIDYNYVSFGAPERLEEVDGAAYARAVQDWEGRLSSAYDDVIDGLRAAALRVMQDLAARLTPGEDGKAKALRPTALRDLQELLGNLPVLNSVGEDNALAEVLARVGVAVQGVDVDVLKDAPAVRAMLLRTASEAAEQLSAMVSTSGRRAMDLG
jgi:hypothetical protein